MKYSFFCLIFWGQKLILGSHFSIFQFFSLRFFFRSVFLFFDISRIIKNIFLLQKCVIQTDFWSSGNFKKEDSRRKRKVKNNLEFVLLLIFWWINSFVLLWFQSMVFYCFPFHYPFLRVLKKNSELKIRSFAHWE